MVANTSRRLPRPTLLRLLPQRHDGEVLCPIRQIASLDLVDSRAAINRESIGISFSSFGFHAVFEEATRFLNIRLNLIEAVDRITHWLPSAAA